MHIEGFVSHIVESINQGHSGAGQTGCDLSLGDVDLVVYRPPVSSWVRHSVKSGISVLSPGLARVDYEKASALLQDWNRAIEMEGLLTSGRNPSRHTTALL